MKIKRVAVVFQNNIQFESFINAVDIMINRGIIVDLFVPITYSNDGFNIMFDEFFKKISKSKYNIYREPTDFYYDILFETYYIEQYKNLKRKYTIKYMYGLTTKPEYSLSLNINYIFDAFLCYGDMDSICLQNYGKTFTIGNIKYLNSKIEEVEKKNKKKTILYLPTYSNCCSIEKIGNDILLLKKHYNIIVKPHHGTEYLTNSLETSRMEFLKRNFDKVYSSTDSLEEIMKKCDLVISDLSGAIFDAICLKKPVITFWEEVNYKYGEFASLPIQLFEQGYFLTIDSKNKHNLHNIVKKALSTNYCNKQNEVFNKVFCCNNSDSGKYFSNALDLIENGAIEDNYYLIHKQVKNEIDNLKNIQNEYNILTKKYNELNQKNEILMQDHQLLNEKLYYSNQDIDNLKNEINLLYNSTSWKITKPLRIFKKIIIKEEK